MAPSNAHRCSAERVLRCTVFGVGGGGSLDRFLSCAALQWNPFCPHSDAPLLAPERFIVSSSSSSSSFSATLYRFFCRLQPTMQSSSSSTMSPYLSRCGFFVHLAISSSVSLHNGPVTNARRILEADGCFPVLPFVRWFVRLERVRL